MSHTVTLPKSRERLSFFFNLESVFQETKRKAREKKIQRRKNILKKTRRVRDRHREMVVVKRRRGGVGC